MKKNKSRRFVLAALTGLLLFSPAQGIRVPEAVQAAQVSSASDSRLSAFDIRPGDLSPAFSPDVYEYTSTVDAGVTSVSVQAVPNAAGATIASVEGRDNLQPGINTIKVTCSAQDNSFSVYTITLTVGSTAADSQETEGENSTQTDNEGNAQPQEGGESDTQTQTDGESGTKAGSDGTDNKNDASDNDKTDSQKSDDSSGSGSVPSKKTLAKLMGTVGSDGAVTLSGATYQLSSNFSYGSITQDIPSAFGEGSLQIGETSYSTLYCESAGIHLVYMENTDGNGSTGFYYYDQKENAVERFKYIGSGDNFVVFTSAARQQLPDGYQEKSLKLPKGQKVAAYQNALSDEMKDYYLVYGIYSDGKDGWYFFDNAQGTYMRYVQTAVVVEEPEEVQQRTVSIEKYNLLYNEYASLRKNGVTIVGALAVAIVVLIIIFTAIVFRSRDDDGETEAAESRRVKKRSKKTEETISKSSLAAGRSLDEKESKGKAKKVTRTITRGTDGKESVNGDKKQQKNMRQEEALQENATRAQKLREVKSAKKADIQEPAGSSMQPSSKETGSRTQSYASSEAGSRTQPYSIYGTGSYTRSRNYNLYGETDSRAMQDMPKETGTRIPQNPVQQEIGTHAERDWTYETGSRTIQDGSEKMTGRTSQDRMYAAGSRIVQDEDVPYEMADHTPQGRIHGTGSRMGQGEDMVYGPGSYTARDAAYGAVERVQHNIKSGPDERTPQDVSYAAESRKLHDTPYGLNERTPQDMPYGPDSRTKWDDMPYGPDGRTQDIPYRPDSHAQDMPYGPDSRAQDMPYGSDSHAQDMPYGPDSRAQDMPYEPDSRTQDMPYRPDSRVQDMSYGPDSRVQDIPHERNSYTQDMPYETGSRVRQGMLHDTDSGQGTVPDASTGQHSESYTAGRRLQRAGIPGSRMQQEMHERDNRLQQVRDHQPMPERPAAEQDPVQLAAENMRRSVQYTRRTPVSVPSEEESGAAPSGSVPHDPMDDWEVGEKQVSRKSHKKRRSLIDEDMEIMDLNDL